MITTPRPDWLGDIFGVLLPLLLFLYAAYNSAMILRDLRRWKRQLDELEEKLRQLK